MIYSSKDMESRAVLDTAAKICAAARTAPKTRGMDGLVTCVLTGEDKSQLAAQMRNLADELDYAFFNRDADNVDASDAVVLFGMEEVRRGLYGGATGYVDFSGDMDFCITIRTMIKKGREVYLQAGAGIVADSVPEKEYQECCNKVMALARTLLEEENL